MRRLLSLATCVTMVSAVALAVFPGWSEEDEPALGTARLEPSGRVLVIERGARPRLASDTEVVDTGTRVKVLDGGATLRMAGNVVLRTRRGSEIEIGRRPNLVAGDLLVVSPDQPLTVITSGGLARVDHGAARLARGHAFAVAVYRGTAQLSSLGRFVPGGVPALRQAVIPAPGLVPAVPTALPLGDPWDAHFSEIVRAAALTRDLDTFSRGITAQLREGEGETVGFYRLVLPELAEEPSFTAERFAAMLDQRTAGENVVGAAIALESREGEFVDRWTRTFSFRSDGAAWGLVALDQGVDRGPVVDTLSLAAGRLEEPGGPAVLAGPPVPEPAQVPPRGPALPRSTPPPTPPRPSSEPAEEEPTGGPVPVPEPPQSGITVIDQTVDPLVDTVGGLLGEVAEALGLQSAPAPPVPPEPSTEPGVPAETSTATVAAPLLPLGDRLAR